jgi:hypothetical protein
MIFCNILRVYAQTFGARIFIVPPYQFGEDNEEGLQSGAYWFYYKLGFRSADKSLKLLAEREWKKIHSGKQYSSPLSILKKFTWSPMLLPLYDAKASPELKQISIAYTSWKAKRFKSEQAKFSAWTVAQSKKFPGASRRRHWPDPERRSFEALLPIIAWSGAMDRCSTAEKKRIVALMRAKGADEFQYSEMLLSVPGLAKAFSSMAGTGI